VFHSLAKLGVVDGPGVAAHQPGQNEHDAERQDNQDEWCRIADDREVHGLDVDHAIDDSSQPSREDGWERERGDIFPAIVCTSVKVLAARHRFGVAYSSLYD